ncbi:transmembrane protein, putative (macronuclear) [Tetrahymena thermophila SB210]|uniref:Transmembrane protein, putative n=1 Tax=Tetrahymena thermophila (strain SB210) TaxID=312017 RepID=W7XCA0_TETTS|nr:transmembrane protein, putative [Tetrahymena thermophila SB210]EWS71351.1 transmembrane protein, putative [Tetrahymena thermophila SB210]|eukprot:XP_012656125.1 transmembrane protein, putative [Tetrahymena thermophila SB210]
MNCCETQFIVLNPKSSSIPNKSCLSAVNLHEIQYKKIILDSSKIQFKTFYMRPSYLIVVLAHGLQCLIAAINQ